MMNNEFLEDFSKFILSLTHVPTFPDDRSYNQSYDTVSYFKIIDYLHKRNPTVLEDSVIYFVDHYFNKGNKDKIKIVQINFIFSLIENLKLEKVRQYIYNKIFTSNQLDHLLILQESKNYQTYAFFYHCPNDLKKQCLNKIFSVADKNINKKSDYYKGDFVYEILKMVSSTHDRNLYYLDFFKKNYSPKERKTLFEYIKYYLSYDFNNFSFYEINHLEKIKTFHPEIKKYLYNIFISEVKKLPLMDEKKENEIISQFYYFRDKKTQLDFLKILTERAVEEKVYIFSLIQKNYFLKSCIEKYENFIQDQILDFSNNYSLYTITSTVFEYLRKSDNFFKSDDFQNKLIKIIYLKCKKENKDFFGHLDAVVFTKKTIEKYRNFS